MAVSMSFGSSVIFMLVGNIVGALAGALATIFAIRSLIPSEWALAAIIIGIGPALGVILSLGSVSYHIRELSKVEDLEVRNERGAVFFMQRLILATPIFVLGLVIEGAGWSLIGLVLVLAGVRLVRGGSSILLSAGKQFRLVSSLLALEKLVYLAVVLTAVFFGFFSKEILAYAYCFSLIVFTVVALSVERMQISRIIAAKAFHSVFKIWVGSRNFGIVSLLGPLQQLDIVIVSALAGTVQAGYFAAGSRSTSGLNVAGGALATVALPYFSEGPRPISLRRIPGRYWVIGGLGLLGAVCMIITTKFWVPVILGANYSDAVPVISLYITASIIHTANFPMLSILQSWGDDRFAMFIAVGQSVGGISGIVVGTQGGGAAGAATSFLVVSIVSFFVLVGRVRRVSIA